MPPGGRCEGRIGAEGLLDIAIHEVGPERPSAPWTSFRWCWTPAHCSFGNRRRRQRRQPRAAGGEIALYFLPMRECARLPVPRRAVRAAAVSIVPEPFRIPAFRAFWLARLTSTIAQMAMIIVIGWQVYDLARETMDLKAAALRLGIIGLVQFAPLFILTLVAGWTADRVDRRWVARGAIALELGCALALAWFAWRGTPASPRSTRSQPCSEWPAPSPARHWERWPPTSFRARSSPTPSLCHRSPGRAAPSPAPRSAATSTRGTPSRPMRQARPCSLSPSPA